MRILLAALLLAGCAEAQDVQIQPTAPAPVQIKTIPLDTQETTSNLVDPADSERANAWYEQAVAAHDLDYQVRRTEMQKLPNADAHLASLDHAVQRERQRLDDIHLEMLRGLSHRDAVAKVQADWQASPVRPAWEAEGARLDLAANPDDDPLNPGYRWRYDTSEVSARYGFDTPFHRMTAPDWVQFDGNAPIAPESGGLRAERPFCWGKPVQGGLVACALSQSATLTVNGKAHEAYKDGVVLVGFDRDAPHKVKARVGQTIHNWSGDIVFDVAPREYDTSRIDGLPKNMVSEYTAEELARIRRATARKTVGFASRIDSLGFADGFISPIQGDYIKTTNFGAQRILNGEPKRPHYGVDMAAPTGTPIVAPADGIVSLADDDMYFEGSLVMIDHGQGLISYYLHNEDILVEDGQTVRQGDPIATVGSRGRSTGPHLCWRLKWHGQNLDPELLTEWPTDG